MKACAAAHAGAVSHIQGEPQRVENHAGQDECPQCLQAPCVTEEQWRQARWPKEGKLQHLVNSEKRKKLYWNFYSKLYNAGTWKDARYMMRKQEALRRDKGRKKMYKWHRRELMPNCVLKLVRGWLPNPDGVPYMGHYWE